MGIFVSGAGERTIKDAFGENEMLGAIRNRDVLLHPVVTIRSFGWRVFLRAAFAGRERTFLSTLQEAGFFGNSASAATDLLERCIQLELEAMRVYELLGQKFAAMDSVSAFLGELAEQERCHAELLQLCRAVDGARRWHAHSVQSWAENVPRLEEQMQRALALADKIDSLDNLARLIIDLESSEMNHIMGQVIETSDSGFVRKLRAFRYALADHIEFICGRLPQFVPGVAATCRQLQAKFGRR